MLHQRMLPILVSQCCETTVSPHKPALVSKPTKKKELDDTGDTNEHSQRNPHTHAIRIWAARGCLKRFPWPRLYIYTHGACRCWRTETCGEGFPHLRCFDGDSARLCASPCRGTSGGRGVCAQRRVARGRGPFSHHLQPHLGKSRASTAFFSDRFQTISRPFQTIFRPFSDHFQTISDHFQNF